MKTLKALKHWIQGYRLHPKEQRRLDELWLNIKVIFLTLGIIGLFVLLLDGCGAFHESIK